MANDAVTVGQRALAGPRDAIAMAATRDRNGVQRSSGSLAKGGAMPECQVAHRPRAGVRMKRANECVDQAPTAASTTSTVADADADLKMHGSERARHAREAIRARQPRGSFDARAIRELSQAAPTDTAQLRRTIRRSELRQMVPLADSTIYELERRGDFPQRFFLTARCVVWDLVEVEAWLRSRRQPGSSDVVKKAPVPDFRRRKGRAGR